VFRACPSEQRDRGYEVVPRVRVRSTHLVRSQSQSGVAYKEVGEEGLTQSQSTCLFSLITKTQR
jgi:hypothetical protein